MTRIFISHSSKDKDFARRLTADLKGLGHDAWLDDEINIGENIVATISHLIAAADCLVIILSKQSVSSHWVEREWSSKYWDEINQKKSLVFPVVIDDCEIPQLLKEKRLADFRTNYAIGLASLHLALNQDNTKVTSGSPPAWVTPTRFSQDFPVKSSQASDPAQTYNLPRPVEAFIKRESHFDEIVNTLSPDYRGWGAAIDGMGGVGKTSIAVEVAQHCHRESLFKKIIWTTAQTERLVLDYEGISAPSGESFRELEGLLDEVIRAFGRVDEKGASYEDILILPLEEKRRVVRSFLSNQPCLLIVDNLETIKHYEPIARFLENTPATTKIITTTRKQYLGRGERQVHLTPMSFEEASQLIRALCELKHIDVSSSYVKKLYESLAGVPLAILWSVGHFRRSPAELDEFLGRLKTIRLTGLVRAQEKQILEFCFREAFETLTERSKKILKTLGLISVPIPRDGLKHILELSRSDFESSEHELVNTSSLIQEQGNGSVKSGLTVLPWTRYFLRYELSEDADFKREIRRRYAESQSSQGVGQSYICAFTPDYRPILLPRGATPLDFAYHIHTDVGHLFAGARINTEPAQVNRPIENGDLVEIMTDKSGPRPDRSWLDNVRTQRAERAITAWITKPHQAIRRVRLGNTLALKCDVNNAGAEYKRAVELNPQNSWAYNRLGQNLRLTGAYDEALRVYKESLSLDPKNPFAFEGIAGVHYQRGSFREAAEHYSQALAIKQSYGNALFGLIRCHCVAGQYQEAKELSERVSAIPIPKRLRATLHLFRMITELGLDNANGAANIHLNNALREFSRIVPNERLQERPYYGSHVLYYYSIALACGNSKNYSGHLQRAIEVCSLHGLVSEILADLRAFKGKLLSPLQEIVAKQFPKGTIENKIDVIKENLEKRIKT